MEGVNVRAGVMVFLALGGCAADAPEERASDGAAAAIEGLPSGGALSTVEPPPVGAAAEFATDFSRRRVANAEIVSGGPPRDGIPAIDEPRLEDANQASEWLEDDEPVALVVVGSEARAYPLQILMWHEIVNDTLGGMPIAVTYCPLCNTAIAFDRRLEERVLDFGTTGRLRSSNLIMYDRQTETWWQQATGEALIGEHVGSTLSPWPASIIAWSVVRKAYPGATVLSRETGHDRPYGQNPYTGYDDVRGSPSRFGAAEPPGPLPAMARVITVVQGDEAVAYPYEVLADAQVVDDIVGSADIVVMWAPGTASALDAATLADGRDVGAAAVFSRRLNGRTLTFVQLNGEIVDDQTNSTWDILGRAVAGELAGRQLDRLVAIDHFWFSWAAFRPDTRVYHPAP